MALICRCVGAGTSPSLSSSSSSSHRHHHHTIHIIIIVVGIAVIITIIIITIAVIAIVIAISVIIIVITSSEKGRKGRCPLSMSAFKCVSHPYFSINLTASDSCQQSSSPLQSSSTILIKTAVQCMSDEKRLHHLGRHRSTHPDGLMRPPVTAFPGAGSASSRGGRLGCQRSPPQGPPSSACSDRHTAIITISLRAHQVPSSAGQAVPPAATQQPH